MATDIKIVQVSTGINVEYDIEFINGEFTIEEGLETAVLMSIYTDRRADNDEELDDINDQRGWWGDQFEDDEIGSKRWLLYRQKITSNTLALLRQYDRDALKWMIDDNVVKDIKVTVERYDRITVAEEIQLYYANDESVAFKFKTTWEAQYAA